MRQAFLRLGEWLGVLAWVLRIRRAVALDGLRRAFPALSEREREKIGRASYVQLGRSLAEILLPVRDEELARSVRFDPWELLHPGPGPEGVVAAVAHFGNFDRARTGVGQIADRGSTGAALAVLRRGEVLGVAVDQNMRASRGIFVDFFGDKACTTPAAAILALRTGARLVAVFPVRQPDGTYVVKVRGPFITRLSGHAAVVDLTEQLTRTVEEEIRLHPDHWFWVHRRWKTRPEVAPASEV